MSLVSLNPPPTFTYYEYGTDITEDDFLINPSDAQDTKFNQITHAMTLAVIDLINSNSSLVPSLVAAAAASPVKMVDLIDFATANPSIDSIMVAKFAERNLDFSGNWKSYVLTNYNYDTTYRPFLRIANWNNFKDNYEPYVACQSELNEEKFTEFDDNYPLWIPNGGSMLFSTLHATQLSSINNPIFVVVNGQPGDDKRDYSQWQSNDDPYVPGSGPGTPGGPGNPPVVTTSCNFNPLPGAHKHERIVQTHFQIDYRYENWGKSEYAIRYVFTRAFNPTTLNWGPYPAALGNQYDKKVSVNKDDVGTLRNWYHEIFSPDKYQSPACIDIDLMYSQVNWKYFGFAAYEWDALTGGKSLGTFVNANGNIEHMYGQRKYAHEFYFFEPGTNNRFEFTNHFPTQWSTYNNYNKGRLIMTRTTY